MYKTKRGGLSPVPEEAELDGVFDVWEESVEKYGEPKRTQIADGVTRVEQDGIRTFVGKRTGQLRQRQIQGYYNFYEGPPGHDICQYCGTNNGECDPDNFNLGAARQGFDCCYCRCN